VTPAVARQAAADSYRAALGSMTDIASPLLSAASVTFTSVILQQPSSFRLGDLAVGALVVAAGLLVFSLQSGFHARAQADFSENLNGRWIQRARRSYSFGLVMLWTGVALALVPPNGGGPMRWVAVGLAAALALFECAWIASSRLRIVVSRRSGGPCSVESLAGEEARLPSGQQPRRGGGQQRHPDDDGGQMDHGNTAECFQVDCRAQA
jgi:hypothetical protein